MPPNHFESEVESFLEGSHGDRTHIKRADHHTVTPLCGTLLWSALLGRYFFRGGLLEVTVVAVECVDEADAPCHASGPTLQKSRMQFDWMKFR